MTDERYKQIMADLGMPNSHSLLQALKQVANETAQEQQRLLAERAKSEEPKMFLPVKVDTLVMTELAELRAKAGFCPKCQNKSLSSGIISNGMRFCKCRECESIAVLQHKY